MGERIEQWIKNNPTIFGKIIAVVVFVFDVCLIIGAIRDWNWLYAPDPHYQSKWGMGQISRYLGRPVARIIGFAGGIFFAIWNLPYPIRHFRNRPVYLFCDKCIGKQSLPLILLLLY